MVSISHVVEDIVKHRPYLSESLAAGIINVSSLARQLQPDVERALQKGVNTGAIVMALNRLAPYFCVLSGRNSDSERIPDYAAFACSLFTGDSV